MIDWKNEWLIAEGRVTRWKDKILSVFDKLLGVKK